MSFWFGYELHQLLFSTINVTSIAGFIGASFCTLLLVLFFEASKVGLAYSKFYSAILRPNEKPECFNEDMQLIENLNTTKSTRYTWLLIEMGFYSIEIILGYVVMLLVMTYNGYLFIAVLVASGVGYFLFGQRLLALQIKTSKLNLICNNCTTNPKNSSITSSSEAISDAINNEQRCCLAANNETATIVAETSN